MLSRLLVDFVRWLVDRWASGQIDKAKKEEEWGEQKDSFKSASDSWRRKRK